MEDHRKLQTLLELLIYLSSGIKYSLTQIMERFDLSDRTAQRYIKTLREAGFIIPRPVSGQYFIDKKSPYFKEISELLHFSREEAHILYKAIHSINDENLLKQNLIKKLYTIYDPSNNIKTIVKQQQSNNIHELTKAIELKRKVILTNYHSANSDKQKDRLVEPFSFTTNFMSTWAYDIEDKCCKTFKNTRITAVKLLNTQWEYENLHHENPMDAFRISSQEQIPVKLWLSMRACELLKEEYPLSEADISPIDDASYKFEFKSSVCGFEGIGRFVLGLCNEIKIVEPTELKDFIMEKIIFFTN